MWNEDKPRFVSVSQVNGDGLLALDLLGLYGLYPLHCVHLRVLLLVLVVELEPVGIKLCIACLPGQAERARVLLEVALEDQVRVFLVLVEVLFHFGATLCLDLVRLDVHRVEDSFCLGEGLKSVSIVFRKKEFNP